QISGGHLRLAGLPICFSRLHFLIGDFYFQLQIRDIDTDDIAFFNKGDRAAHRCLRRNVSYGRSPGSAAETSVCDQGDGGAQSHTVNGVCGVQHLSLSRTAFRSFVTDHDHVAFHDLAAFDRRDGVFFTVEDSRRSFVYHHLLHNGRTLHNAAVRSQIAFQHRKAACLAVRIVDGADHLGIQVYTVFDVLAYCLSCHCHAVCVKESFFVQLVHHRIDAAGLIEVLDIGGACRSKMTEIRSFLADLICKTDIEIHSDLMSDGRKVKHTVGGATKGHIHGQSVQDRLLRHDVSRTDILPVHFH